MYEWLPGEQQASGKSIYQSLCYYTISHVCVRYMMENKMANKEFVHIVHARKKIVRILYTLEPPLAEDSEPHSLLRCYNYEYDLGEKDRRYIIEETPHHDYFVTLGDCWMSNISRSTILYKLGFVQNFMVRREIWVPTRKWHTYSMLTLVGANVKYITCHEGWYVVENVYARWWWNKIKCHECIQTWIEAGRVKTK